MKVKLGLFAIALGCAVSTSIANEAEHTDAVNMQELVKAATDVLLTQERNTMERERSELDQQYATLKEKQELLAQKKAELAAESSTLEDEITTLQSQLERVESAREELNSNISTLVAEASTEGMKAQQEASVAVSEIMTKMKTVNPDLSQEKLTTLESAISNALLEEATGVAYRKDDASSDTSKVAKKEPAVKIVKATARERNESIALQANIKDAVSHYADAEDVAVKDAPESKKVVTAAAPEKGDSYVQQLSTEAGNFTTVVVKAGDNLSKIAENIFGSKDKAFAIFEDNKHILTNPDIVPVGEILRIFK